MKTRHLFFAIPATILFTGCNNDSCNDSCNDKGEIIAKKATIDSLNQINFNLKAEIKIKQGDIETLEQQIRTLKTKTSTADEKAAIEAIKYELKMYHPDVEYSAIRTVRKSDGTVDVILDIPDVFNSHKYYNVSTFSDGSYKINKDWGLVF